MQRAIVGKNQKFSLLWQIRMCRIILKNDDLETLKSFMAQFPISKNTSKGNKASSALTFNELIIKPNLSSFLRLYKSVNCLSFLINNAYITKEDMENHYAFAQAIRYIIEGRSKSKSVEAFVIRLCTNGHLNGWKHKVINLEGELSMVTIINFAYDVSQDRQEISFRNDKLETYGPKVLNWRGPIMTSRFLKVLLRFGMPIDAQFRTPYLRHSLELKNRTPQQLDIVEPGVISALLQENIDSIPELQNIFKTEQESWWANYERYSTNSNSNSTNSRKKISKNTNSRNFSTEETSDYDDFYDDDYTRYFLQYCGTENNESAYSIFTNPSAASINTHKVYLSGLSALGENARNKGQYQAKKDEKERLREMNEHLAVSRRKINSNSNSNSGNASGYL